MPPAFRLPEVTHVGRVRLQVADLARSAAYYKTVIGLRTLSSAHGSATMGAMEDDTPLVSLHEKRGVSPVPRRGLLGLYHFAILLPDRAALGRFVAHLAEIDAHAGMSDHFVSEAVYLTDPDGLGIEVYADRPRSKWRFEGGQLHMTTNPLDVNDLIQAADGEQWAGMPRGTTIGHVHLYVGDIEQAAQFYHDGLGLDKTVSNYPGALFLSAGGYHHHLGVNTWAAEAKPATDADARLLDWEVVLPDAQSVTDTAESIQAAGFLVGRNGDEALATDPWGITVRIGIGKKWEGEAG